LRLTILAVGRASDSIAKLYDDYARRLRPRPTLVEVEERRRLSAAERRASEGRRLLAAIPEGATVVALAVEGAALSSETLAIQLGRWTATTRDLCFIIGGADGLDPAVIERATLRVSLGAMTWPHLLARVMLIEQLYRAETIRRGHPYHRG
jgi:23S rRNA (pseudouridine1915-N3)-methyltransferase